MRLAEKNTILEQLGLLNGTRLLNTARIGATGDISFASSASDERIYSLQITCSFRFRSGEKLLTATLDIFDPTKSVENSPSFSCNTFNWDVLGFNRYDEWSREFKKEHQEQLTVQNVSVSDFGDLTIEFDKGILLEIFINANGGECWRFFEKSWDKHFIVCGDGTVEFTTP